MKKVLALFLAMAMIASMAVGASATVTTGDKEMTVTYTVAPAYTVTIPSSIAIAGNGTATGSILAEGVVVNKGKYVSITLAADNNFTVTTPEGATLTYTVTVNNQSIAAGGEILAVNPADATTDSADISFNIDTNQIQYAGTYTGAATFNIAVKSWVDNTVQ